jgi:hypothetical protein
MEQEHPQNTTYTEGKLYTKLNKKTPNRQELTSSTKT